MQITRSTMRIQMRAMILRAVQALTTVNLSHPREWSWMAAAVFLAALPLHLHATAFYVSCDRGSDSADGHSQQTSWQHLQAVNAYAQKRGFQPGDSILLKRGCRWREQMELLNSNPSGSLPNSGSDGKPITISSYGTGDFPTIDGADLATAWKSAAPGTFVAPISGLVYKVFVDGDARETEPLQAQPNFLGQWTAGTTYRMWDYVTNQGKPLVAMRDVSASARIETGDWYRAPDISPEQKTTGLANVTKRPGSWFLDTGRKLLYVHLADGIDPSRHKIQITRRSYGIELQGLNHVVVDGLRVIHAAKSGILASVYAPNQGGAYMTNEYNTVQNSIFWNNGDTSMDVLPGTGMQGEGAIYVAASSKNTDSPLRGWVIQRNAVGAIDSQRLTNYDRSGISVTGTDGLALRNNYVATDGSVGVSVFTDRGPRCLRPTIDSNHFAANQGNLRISGCSDPVADSNTIAYSYGYGIQIGGNSSGAMITHNLIHDLTVTPKGNLYNGIDCNGGAPGGTLAFNTVEAVWAADATLEVGCDHWTVRNNIFDSSNNAQHGGLTLYIRKESLPGMKFEQNVYRVDPNVKRQFNVGAGQPGAQTFHDIGWWQANQESTARNADKPLFMKSPNAEYALRDAATIGTAPRGALPLHPFVPGVASTTYLREAAKIPWEQQNRVR